jgi:hypothetical protein
MLAMLPVFRGASRLVAFLRVALVIGGLLSLAGVFGPALGNIDFRWIGQVGYEAVFPVVCLLIALVFRQTAPSAPSSPLRNIG